MRTIINTTSRESRDGNGKPANAAPATVELPSLVSGDPTTDCRRQSTVAVSLILREDDAKRPH